MGLRPLPLKSSQRRGYSRWRRWLIGGFLLGLCLVLAIGTTANAQTQAAPSIAHIKLYSTPVGVSTEYIGACEGNVDFDITDLTNLGINTYRLYGGMSRWETEDDDNAYGIPTIAQIKANPDIIPWQRWDAVMANPATGSDYAFSGPAEELWQGSAQSLFAALKQANIRPVLTIRNSDPGWSPAWALQLNPPRTEADWNEWWEHVFATVYWLNVRHDYQVDDFEIHNEPDNRQQGWGGNQDDYFDLVQVATDAIAYVYANYLPDRSFHIHAPKTTGGSSWPQAALATIPSNIDSINVHNYDWDIAPYIRQVRHWMQETIHGRSPLWIGEWGTYTEGYDDFSFSLNLLKNMIQMARPGETHVYGSHLFSLYDWGRGGDFQGLIAADGTRRLSYFAFRMGIRALQGGREVLLTAGDSSALTLIATRDDASAIALLVVNDSPSNYLANIDTQALSSPQTAKVWSFEESIWDEVVAETTISSNRFSLEVPAQSGRLVMLN